MSISGPCDRSQRGSITWQRGRAPPICDGSGDVSDQNLACFVSAPSRAATLITVPMAVVEAALKTDRTEQGISVGDADVIIVSAVWARETA